MATGDGDGLELFDIFLCYSWYDKELVDAIAQAVHHWVLDLLGEDPTY